MDEYFIRSLLVLFVFVALYIANRDDTSFGFSCLIICK